MKKHFQPLLSGFLALLFALFANSTVCAQGLMIDRTSVNVPTFRNETTNFSTRFNNGCTFVGQRVAFYANSQITSLHYVGTLTYPDGTKVISANGTFDQNFAANGSFGVEKDGQLYFYNFRNGYMQDQFTPTNRYIMVNNHIEFVSDTSTSVPYVPAPTNNSGSSSSGSSSGTTSRSWTDEHRATCSGCHGSGSCDHCHGSGINSRGHSCGHCRGTGRCLSCKGAGYIYVY